MEPSWVASTLTDDILFNSCGVAVIRRIYLLPGSNDGALNNAWPITSFF